MVTGQEVRQSEGTEIGKVDAQSPNLYLVAAGPSPCGRFTRTKLIEARPDEIERLVKEHYAALSSSTPLPQPKLTKSQRNRRRRQLRCRAREPRQGPAQGGVKPLTLAGAKRMRRSAVHNQRQARKCFQNSLDIGKEAFELESRNRRRWRTLQAHLKKTHYKEPHREDVDYFTRKRQEITEKRTVQREWKNGAWVHFRHAISLLDSIREEFGKRPIKRNLDDLFASVVIRKDTILKK